MTLEDRAYYRRRRDEWLARAESSTHANTAKEYRYMAERYDRLANFAGPA